VVVKQVVRHRTRSFLTIAGVMVAMFLFITVQTLQQGVQEATEVSAADQTLIVYRENRFCPATSRLPEHYQTRIEKVAGVASVVPMKIIVTNCAASIDVITFRGIPADRLDSLSKSWTLVNGSLEQWRKRSDSALVGERLALRRGFKTGQSFDASGVTVNVAGVIRSLEPQDQDVAYVHLDFLQRSSSRGGLGIVTQFNVRTESPTLLGTVAKQIDDEFRTEAEPTQTRPERAFVAQAGSDIVEIVGFTKVLGWGCLAAVLALVANAIVLSVQDRVREHAVLQTLGFRSALLARIIVSEGALMGMSGGALGTLAALVVIHYGNFSLYNEGLSIGIQAEWSMVGVGLLISAGVGVLAGLVPAIQAGRREIAHCFRAV
jgi:putative ABC transport system permease protein